jgi:hypothetical protein
MEIDKTLKSMQVEYLDFFEFGKVFSTPKTRIFKNDENELVLEIEFDLFPAKLEIKCVKNPSDHYIYVLDEIEQTVDFETGLEIEEATTRFSSPNRNYFFVESLRFISQKFLINQISAWGEKNVDYKLRK